MEIYSIKSVDGIPEYYIVGYDSDEEFSTINRLLINIVGIKRIEKIVTPFALINIYKYKGGEVRLITDDYLFTYLTIKKKEDEKIINLIIDIIKKIPNLDKYEPFLKRLSKWVKKKINPGIRK